MVKGRVIPPVFTRWFLRSLHLITWKFTQPPFGASAAPVLTSKQETAPRRGWANRSTGGRAKTGAAVRSHFMWITALRSTGCHHRWNEISFLSLFFFTLQFSEASGMTALLTHPLHQLPQTKQAQSSGSPSHSLEMPPLLNQGQGTAPPLGSRSYKFPCECWRHLSLVVLLATN